MGELFDFLQEIGGSTPIDLNSDVPLCWGDNQEFCIVHETADPNAHELLVTMPDGDATDVPVVVFGLESSILNVDLGLFDGVTDPSIALVGSTITDFARLFVNSSGNSEIVSSGNLILTPTSTVQIPNDITLAFGTDETRTIDYSSSSTNWTFTGNAKFEATIDSTFREGLESDYDVTGVDAGNRVGQLFSLSGDYSGAGTVSGISFDVTVNDATAASYVNDTSLFGYRGTGTRGITGFSRGVTDAIRFGGQFGAGGSSAENYGVWGTATVTRSGAQNIGVFGAALNGAGVEFAGGFVLGSRATQPITRATSAALLADNSTLAEDIFVAMDNGSDVFVIADGGDVTQSNPGATTSNIFSVTSGGTTVINEGGLDIDFRVEGDSFPNLIVTDGTRNTIGFGATSGVSFVGITKPAATITSETSEFEIDSSNETTITTGFTDYRINKFGIPRVSISSGQTVTNAATVYIAGRTQNSGLGSITNNYSLWVDEGDVRFDGDNLAPLLFMDSSNDSIAINSTGGAGSALLSVTGKTLSTSTEVNTVEYDFANTHTTTSSISQYSSFLITEPDLAPAVATTIINAATVRIEGAPTNSGAGTFVNSYALYIAGGDTRLNDVRVDGNIQMKQGQIVSTTRVTSGPYRILDTDNTIYCDTDGGAFTANLPAGVDGQTYRIINVGSSGNNLTIAPNGSELLKGANASKTLSDDSVVILTYETTEGWW